MCETPGFLNKYALIWNIMPSESLSFKEEGYG
jgi:hypothetical protein